MGHRLREIKAKSGAAVALNSREEMRLGFLTLRVGFIPHRCKGCWLFVTFGEHGIGLLPATHGIGSKWTC